MIGLDFSGSRLRLADNKFDSNNRYPRQAVASPVEFWMVQTRSIALANGAWRWECGPASAGMDQGVAKNFALDRGVATK